MTYDKPKMQRFLLTLLAASAFLAPSLSAGPLDPLAGSAAAPATHDKWHYHLFKPTPRELMRDLSADRPDATESPYTVDSGHFQIETTFASFTRDESNGVDVETWSFGAFNLKAGLLNNVDIQFVFDSYTREESIPDAGVSQVVEGLSDLQIRLKVNLWGNDEGRTALAFFPFVKVTTGSRLSNDRVEGGVILPFSVALSDRLGLGLQAEVDLVYEDERDDYEAEFLHTIVLGFAVTDRLGAYIEYLGVAEAGVGDEYQASFSGGLTFALSEDAVLDAGTVIGLNEAADDISVFTGMTIRF